MDFRLVRSAPSAGLLDAAPGSPIDLLFNAPPNADTVVRVNIRLFAGLVETSGALTTDLLDQRVRFAPFEPLLPNLRHQVYVHQRVAGLNGATLGQTVVFNFTTGEQRRTPPEATPPAPGAGELQPLWDEHCASCHRSADPPAGVDLSSPETALASLRNVPSTFGTKVRVLSGDHARSYLMLKLLAAGGYVGFPMPPDGPRLSRQELRRVVTWIDGGALP